MLKRILLGASVCILAGSSPAFAAGTARCEAPEGRVFTITTINERFVDVRFLWNGGHQVMPASTTRTQVVVGWNRPEAGWIATFNPETGRGKVRIWGHGLQDYSAAIMCEVFVR